MVTQVDLELPMVPSLEMFGCIRAQPMLRSILASYELATGSGLGANGYIRKTVDLRQFMNGPPAPVQPLPVQDAAL